MAKLRPSLVVVSLVISAALGCGDSVTGGGPIAGSVEVTTATTGLDFDPDGYTVSLDGGAAQAIASESQHAFTAVAPGSHQVQLAGLTPNCAVQGDNPRGVTVTAGATATATFAVQCSSLGVTRWTPIPLPSDFVAEDIWASSPSNIFVVGESRNPLSSRILHYDGNRWIEQFQGRFWEAQAVWGSSPSEVFVVGEDRALRYNGSGWTDIPRSQDEIFIGFEVIWGTSSQDLWAGGTGGASTPQSDVLQHYDGTSWGAVQSMFGTYGYISDISGTSLTDVYLVGRGAPYDPDPGEQFVHYAIMHYDGSSWRPSFESTVYPTTPPGEGVAPSSVWAIAGNDVFVVAYSGHILHFDGAAWSPMTSPTTQSLASVWGGAGHDVYAVGAGGIFRYDGVRWAVVNPTPATQVWGAGDDVFAITAGAVLHGSR